MANRTIRPPRSSCRPREFARKMSRTFIWPSIVAVTDRSWMPRCSATRAREAVPGTRPGRPARTPPASRRCPRTRSARGGQHETSTTVVRCWCSAPRDGSSRSRVWSSGSTLSMCRENAGPGRPSATTSPLSAKAAEHVLGDTRVVEGQQAASSPSRTQAAETSARRACCTGHRVRASAKWPNGSSRIVGSHPPQVARVSVTVALGPVAGAEQIEPDDAPAVGGVGVDLLFDGEPAGGEPCARSRSRHRGAGGQQARRRWPRRGEVVGVAEPARELASDRLGPGPFPQAPGQQGAEPGASGERAAELGEVLSGQALEGRAGQGELRHRSSRAVALGCGRHRSLLYRSTERERIR